MIVGDQIDVICEGGVQRGTHVLKALSVGAKAVSGGRYYLYPLAAAGEAVAWELTIIEEKLIQFRAKATQDLINYPVRLNDKLSTLFTLVEFSDSPPAAQDYELFDELKERIVEVVDELDDLVDNTDWSTMGMEVD